MRIRESAVETRHPRRNEAGRDGVAVVLHTNVRHGAAAFLLFSLMLHSTVIIPYVPLARAACVLQLPLALTFQSYQW